MGQLRFPTILKINDRPPSEFPDKIRFDYPIFQQSQELNLPPDIAALVPQIGSLIPQYTTYKFLSVNSKWQLSLNRDNLTLSTVEYKRYEEFKEKFIKAVKFFEELYNPPFYIRLGLRYKELILRSKLKIDEKPWSQLISQQADVVFRKHQARFQELRKGKIVGSHDKPTVWKKPQTCPQGLTKEEFATVPQTLTVREIHYYIAIPGFRTQQVSLITTLLDQTT